MDTIFSYINVELERIHENAIIPSRANEFAAGADLYSIEDVSLRPGDLKFLRTGWKMSVPEGCYIEVYNRSGMAAKRELLIVSSCVIDSDYRGEVFIPMKNIGKNLQIIKKGDRIAQMIVKFIIYTKFEEVDKLQDTERGDGGFGSTGK